MKKTVLTSIHEQLGARMVEFAGWWMPVQYTGIIAEHNAVRTHAGIFDLSHMGEINVRGPQAEEFVQLVITNNVAPLAEGRILYSPLCNEQGGVVDDILIYRMLKDEFMLVVNASNTAKDLAWLNLHIEPFDAVIADHSDTYALIAVQGPGSMTIMEKIAADALKDLRYYSFVKTTIEDMPVVLSRTGYTGEDGYEIYVGKEHGAQLWQLLMRSSGEKALVPIGLGARDSLRLEACFALYGHELDDMSTPFDAGIGWTVKLDKKDFIGKDALVEKKEKRFQKKLIPFVMKDGSIPRHGCPVYINDRRSGAVTSGMFSPTLKKGIGMAYVFDAGCNTGVAITVEIRDIKHPAVVVERPFYKSSRKQQTASSK